MYIEASNAQRNQRARLLSPMETYTGTACLSFWFHMYGSAIGTLNVYKKQGGTLGQPIWKRTRNQGNKWIQGQVTVNPAGKSYQVGTVT